MKTPEFEGLSFLTVKSKALRGRGDITFFIPPAAKSKRHVPLVILLHGVDGSHWNWAVKGGAHRTVQRLLRQKQIPPMALAMPSDGLWDNGSAYVPHSRRDFEKWIVDEVPAAMRNQTPCLSAKSPVFLCGLSMGGFGALRLGAKYPKRFRAFSGHSSITQLKQLVKYMDDKGALLKVSLKDQSVLETMLRNRRSLPPFRFDCGTKDRLLKRNRELHRALEAHGIPHAYEEFSGGHEWPYWTKHLEDSLRFFAKIQLEEISTMPKASKLIAGG